MSGIKWFLAVAVLALSACAGGGSTVPSGPPAPPRPGVVVFTADFTGPSIGVGLTCNGDTPPVCSGDAEWLTFNGVGRDGQGCVDPGPNDCYRVDADGLHLFAVSPGWPIISKTTFAKHQTLSIETLAAATCKTPGCWGGLVLYNGEQDWRSLYFATGPSGKLSVGMWGPTFRKDFATVPEGTFHALRIDYFKGEWKYYLDGVLSLTETAGSLSSDPVMLTDDPHLALFMGDLDLTVKSLNVTVAP